MNYRYIVVEGPIGSMKTELAEKLAFFFNGLFFREDVNKNPFLFSFLQQPSSLALATQLHFLLDRYRILQEIEEKYIHSEVIILSDFLLEKDRIFAPATLTAEELELYWRLRLKLVPSVLRPNLIILLEASLETLYANLSKRNAQIELYPEHFLEEILKGYQHFFYIHDEIPQLIANTDELDFLNNTEHFNLLIKTMKKLQGKTNYINLDESL